MEFPPTPPALPAPIDLTGPTAPPPADLVIATEAEIHRARGFVEASRATSTRRAYANDWRLHHVVR